MGTPLPLPARIVVGTMGIGVLAVGVGWLVFLLWIAFVHDGPNRWLSILLVVGAVPCFSFGRQWVLEGLGRPSNGVGKRWRRVAGGVVSTLYGAAFAVAPFSLDLSDHSPVGALIVAIGPISLGVSLVAIGVLLAVGKEPPAFVAWQVSALLVLAGCGSIVALAVCWIDDVAYPAELRLPLAISLGMLVAVGLAGREVRRGGG